MHEGSCKKLMGELILSINFKELPANKTCAFYKKIAAPCNCLQRAGRMETQNV